MRLSEEEIQINRCKIESLLSAVRRDGMESVMRYLSESGFYEVPSSRYRHHNWRGGLAQHCLRVFTKALELDDSLPMESLIIAGILHDVCKAEKYYYDDLGVPHHKREFIISGHGHGLRSIKILDVCGLAMAPEERRAIRWHMGGHHANGEDEAEVQLARSEPLWQAIHKADQINAKNNN